MAAVDVERPYKISNNYAAVQVFALFSPPVFAALEGGRSAVLAVNHDITANILADIIF